MHYELSLNASVGITACKSLNFSSVYKVVVAVDGMLQSRSSHSKLKSLALSRLCQQTVNKTARERVAATYTVDDRIDLVAL